ncbi:hypothetical protein F2P56_011634 [Juglans regia]|uniref:Exosome complex component RRP45A-like n=1 Tax=Juglans regia TaxID=51240 RepID=A0A833XTT5_JUGRE|nr:hypothetical protein F2P56_011634 [Juglans regia]
MEPRLANTWRLTVNEKKFIETALQSDLRIDGRRPFDYRNLSIKFGREDGSAEVQLGQTHVMGFVTAQLVQPYKDRPNEGTLSIFTEFSPMADPSFEAGRPGEAAVELGRVIDRGLRESRAVDTESLCVLSGKLVWAVRVDLHILDNGGNLVDAANIAALAALLTFRRPECSLGGEDGQEVIVHPAEVIDPTHYEEAVMGGRMTATLNANNDVCAIQKAGGEGVLQSVIMQCLRIAGQKAYDITTKIKNAVESYNTERASWKIKRHTTSVSSHVSGAGVNVGKQSQYVDQKHVSDRSKLIPEKCVADQSMDIEGKTKSSKQGQTNRIEGDAKNFIGGPSSWDPYSGAVNADFLKASLASRGTTTPSRNEKDSMGENSSCEVKPVEPPEDINSASPTEAADTVLQTNREKTLKDAVKPKHKRKNKASFASES